MGKGVNMNIEEAKKIIESLNGTASINQCQEKDGTLSYPFIAGAWIVDTLKDAVILTKKILIKFKDQCNVDIRKDANYSKITIKAYYHISSDRSVPLYSKDTHILPCIMTCPMVSE